MDIQIGDRVTYKSVKTGRTATLIIDGTAVQEDIRDNRFFEILKIERPKYETIEF